MKTLLNEPVVFVVDDDEDVRQALKWLLGSVALKVETFASAEQFLRSYTPDRSGCVVLDVRMPGMGGLELLKRLHAKGVSLPVIILTGHADVPMAVQVLKGGAFDLIEKPFSDEYLLEQIRHALEAHARQHEGQAKRATVMARFSALTPREHEVFERVVQGQTNKAIAAALGIAEKTVETYRRHLMEKMQASSLAELVTLSFLLRED
jgi:FixJ family two-component response regulator